MGQCPSAAPRSTDLSVIRAALAVRPDVATPPGGRHWSGFMARLRYTDCQRRKSRAGREHPAPANVAESRGAAAPRLILRPAAVHVLVTLSAVVHAEAARRLAAGSFGRRATPAALTTAPVAQNEGSMPRSWMPAIPVLTAIRRPFRPSATSTSSVRNSSCSASPPRTARQADWAYERQLAGTLLSDTRSSTAWPREERGMQSLRRR
jgi:hypothetical protein